MRCWRSGQSAMHDHHTHIGQFYDVYYDFHDVFSALKDNGVTATTFAYLTPLFEKSEPAIEFYRAMTDEVKDALAFAEEIGLEANALYWIDPMVLFGGVTLDSIMSDVDYKGLVIHPFLNDWNPANEKNARLLTGVFEFADKSKYDIYFHTGCSERDEPLQFEKWFADFPNVKVHLAHCKDPEPIIELFSRHENLVGDTAFCPEDSYKAICAAGFKDRMFFGTDFPITHYWETRNSSNKTADRKMLTENYRRLLQV